MLSEKDQEFIDKYVNGNLSGDELRQAEERILNDKEFAEQVAFTSDLKKVIKQSEREELKKKLRSISVKYEYEDAAASKSNRKNYLSIAATVAFLFIATGLGYYLGISTQHSELANEKNNNLKEHIRDSIEQHEFDSYNDRKGFGFAETDSTKKIPSKISFSEGITKGLFEYTIVGAHDQRVFPGETDADGLHYGKCIILILESKIDSMILLGIECGRELIPLDSTVQTMIITKEAEIPLYPKLRAATKVYAMCGEIHDYAPDINSSFKYGEMSDTNLIRLAKIIERKFMQNMVAQDAIWAVANNASIEELVKYGADKTSLALTRDLLNEGGYVTQINPRGKIVQPAQSESSLLEKLKGKIEINKPAAYLFAGIMLGLIISLIILLKRNTKKPEA